MATIQEVKDKIKSINLKDFADKHYKTNFRAAGSLYQTSCCLPGHKHDDSPSLTYYPESNSLTCFGCEEIKGGDIITFVSLMEGLEQTSQGFVEIIKRICKMENIECNLNSKPVDPKIKQLKEYKTKCATLYRDNLWADKNSYGFNYLIDRGITENTIRAFHLGLTSENESRYGRVGISNRICIPILDSAGSGVIACSFRQLSGSDKEAKYIHDKNDEVFNKSNVFYGWSHAIESIRKLKHVYITEGYFDMISLYQAGLKNTLACMSNRMTEGQIKILASVTKNVTIILDQDEAGLKGFRETLPMMIREGLNVRVVPSLGFKGKDPNDVCNRLDWNGEEIQAFLSSQDKDAVQFLLSSVLDKYDDVILRARDVTLRTTVGLLDCITDPIKKKNYELYVNGRMNL